MADGIVLPVFTAPTSWQGAYIAMLFSVWLALVGVKSQNQSLHAELPRSGESKKEQYYPPV